MVSREDLLSIPGVSVDRLRQWSDADLLPRGQRDVTKRGRPKLYPDETVRILRALVRHRAEGYGRIDAMGFAAWEEGQPVPFVGIRPILERACEEPGRIMMREIRKRGSAAEIAAALVDVASDLPSQRWAARSPVARRLRQRSDDGIDGAAVALMFAAHEPTDEPPETWEADFSEVSETDRAAGLVRGFLGEDSLTPTEMLAVLVEAGILPLAQLPETLDSLTEAQLSESRGLTRSLLLGISTGATDGTSSPRGEGGLKTTVDAFLGRPDQWKTRAVVVVCVAALLRIDEGQNRERLEGIIGALSNSVSPSGSG